MKSTYAILALATFSMGCRKPAATDEDYDNVATAVGALTGSDSGGETASMAAAADLSLGKAGAFKANAAGALEGNLGAFKYAYKVTCKDGSGAAMPTCTDKTGSANLVVDWSGSLDLSWIQATVARTGDWTLSGLQTPTAQFDGHGTFDVATTVKGILATRSFTLDYDGDYQAVRWDRATKKVLAGAIAYTVRAHSTVDKKVGTDREVDFDVDVRITFDGSGSAHMIIDGTRHYLVDLKTGAVTKA